MPTLPAGLTTLLQVAPLPTAALLAAVEQRPLQAAVARRCRLPGAVVERCFVVGQLPPIETARMLVDQPLPARVVRHILRTSGEQRPTVLAALLGHNVPAARDRRGLLSCGDETIDEAILANAAWPVDEQIEVARRAGGIATLRWLAQLDPSVPICLDDLVGLIDRGSQARLDADPVTALQALVRRPWLSDLPLELAGPGLRSAIATVTSDERTLYRLLGRAQRLAARGRTLDAATLVEAVACNPSAPLAVQRRCRWQTRRLHCHYLLGWLPQASADGPLWQTDATGQRRAIDRLEALTRVRHRTVWSAGLLAANPHLAPDVRDRIIAYLDRHLAAVDTDGRSVDVLAARLAVDQDTRDRWHEHCRSPRSTGDEGNVSLDAVPSVRGGHQAGGGVLLDNCLDAATACRGARHLTQAFGHDQDAWTIALLLLREGWNAPLGDLPAIVGALAPAEEVPA